MRRSPFVFFLPLILCLVIIVTGCSCGSDPSAANSADSVPLIDVPPELLADYKLPAEEAVTGPPVINSINPPEGRIGSEIAITGSNFGNSLEGAGITIGDKSLEIISWQDDAIVAKILTGTSTGKFEVTTQGGKVSEKNFVIQKETLTLLASETIDANEPKIVETGGGLAVAVPAGTTSGKDKLTVSSVENGPVFESIFFEAGKMFNIEIESGDDLLKPVALEFELEAGQNPADSLICYFDEVTSSWVNVPAVYDVKNGKAAVITDHFSQWLMVHIRTGGKFLADDYFIIAYTSGDTVNVPGISSIEELATTVSGYLKQAYLTYKGVLSSQYMKELSKKDDAGIVEKFAQSEAGKFLTSHSNFQQSDFTALADSLNVRDRVIIELNSKHNGYGGSTGFSLKWSKRTIYLPTKYTDDASLKATAAHELFHNIQTNVFFGVEMSTSWNDIHNKWLIEATAEYAAWGIAYPESRPKAIHEYTRTAYPYHFFSNRADGQEYGMSFFVEYVLQRGDKNFNTLYGYMVNNRPGIGGALEEYAKDKTGSTIGMLYLEFWRDLYTVNTMPKYIKPDLLLPLGVKNQAALIEGKRVIEPGAVRGYFSFPSFPDNCENLVVCYAPSEGKMPAGTSVSVAQMDNFEISNLDTWEQDPYLERTPATLKWTLMTETDVMTHHYATFQKNAFKGNKYQVAILVYDAYNKHDPIKMDINYIVMEITPKSIDNVRVGEEIEFTASLSNIFKQAKKMELVWDFGDGNTEKTQYSSYSATIKNSVKHKYSKEGNYTITVSLFDTTDGRKLIAERIIELGQGVTLNIEQKPENPGPNEEITFSTEGKPGWYYTWELGDYQIRDSIESELKYTYTSNGRYTVTVTAFEDSYKKKVVGFGTKEVVVDDQLLDLWITPSRNLEAAVGDLVEIGVEPADKTQSLEGYQILWSASGADEKTQDGSRLRLRYEKPGTYSIEVSAVAPSGITMGSGSATIHIVQSKEDPYRQFDSGFFQYDYSLLYYETGAKKVTYKSQETNRNEGMEIEFFDEALTRPYTIRYYKADMTVPKYWYVGTEEFNEDGTLKYREYVYMENGVKCTDEYKFRYGVLGAEVHTVNDKLHGPALYFNGNIWGDNPAGQITKTEYYEGKRHGVEYISFSDAIAGTEPSVWMSIIEYQNGVYHGSYKTFNKDGTIVTDDYYVNGIRQPK